MPAPLAVKNYTCHRLNVRVAEHQVVCSSKQDGTRILLADIAYARSPPFSARTDDDASVLGVIEPFSLCQFSVPAEEHVHDTRFEFVDSAGNRATSSIFLPAKSRYADVFHHSGYHGPMLDIAGIYQGNEILVITRRTNLQQWMQPLPDHIPLELLSIPGTHNSTAYHRALPSIRCQVVSPREQLENGIRFLDVRLQVDKPNDRDSDALSLVHASYPVALIGSWKFRSLYEEVLDFLNRNPSETIIMSLKREGRGSGTDADLAKRLHAHYINEEHWMTKPGIPTLGEARGKIVILRRFHLSDENRQLYSRVIGVDAQVWEDNSSNSCAGDVHIQDFYHLLHTDVIEKKMQYVIDHCKRANATTLSITPAEQTPLQYARGPLFLNFLSGSNLWKKACWPERIAAKVNPAIAQRLCDMEETNKERGMGILIMDWVGEDGNFDLVRMIVAMNEKLLATTSRC